MPDSQIYRVFLLKSNKLDDAQFLYSFKQHPNLRPKVGDVLTNPLTLVELKILHDITEPLESTIFRLVDTLAERITDEGDTRVTQVATLGPDEVTHNYYVTPANNPQRISSWSRTDFANDQTLKQLFR